jgi:hypothetical protein
MNQFHKKFRLIFDQITGDSIQTTRILRGKLKS